MTDSEDAVTRRNGTLTTAKLCAYCRQDIHWMLTRYNTRMPFDADLLPAELAPHGVGWLPGQWKIRGRIQHAMAPIEDYTDSRRTRITRVFTTHQCRGRVAARKAWRAAA